MSRNEERLGAIDQAGAEAPPISENSILDFVFPTEFVDLPSQGRFYSEEHPLHNKESVEIRYMTAKDTDILTSKSLLKKGVALDRVLQNILVDKSIKIDSLIVGDKNALVVAARISGFGAEYKTNITCPACGTTGQAEFDLSAIEPHLGDHEFKLSPEGTFKVMLPKTGVEAECKLLIGEDEKAMFKSSEKRKKHNLSEEPLTAQYKRFIVSLNGHTERGLVEKFVDAMPALDSSYLRKVYSRVAPSVEMKQDYACSSCDADTIVDIPFSANFFWPDR
jgi:hypothetical protein